jgi:MFS family permease
MASSQSIYRDIWKTTLILMMNEGFTIGLTQYVYRVFLFEHFGSDHFALKFVAVLVILNSLFTIFLEVPTGAIGDYFGRKKAVIFSLIFFSLSFLFKTFVFFSPQMVTSVFLTVFAEFLDAVGYTFSSGALFAWIVDSIHTNNIKEGHGPILAKGISYKQIGRIAGSAISLTAYLLGHIYIGLLMGMISYGLIAVYCAVTMKETAKMDFYKGGLSVKLSLIRMREIVKVGFESCIKIPTILYLIVLNSMTQLSIYVVFFLWAIVMKVNFGFEKMSFYWYLVVFGSFVASFFGAKLVEKLNTDYFHKYSKIVSNQVQWIWVVSVCLILSTVMIGLGLLKMNGYMTLAVFIAAVIAVNFCFGFLWPEINALFNYFIPEELSPERATIMSFSSMVQELFMIILFYPASGNSGENTVIGWMIPATLLLLITIGTNFLMKRYEQRNTGLELKNTIKIDGNPEVEPN